MSYIIRNPLNLEVELASESNCLRRLGLSKYLDKQTRLVIVDLVLVCSMMTRIMMMMMMTIINTGYD